MPIQTKLKDERGNTLATLASPSCLTNWLFRCTDLTHTTCLRFINFYGDAIFNRAQMQVLSQELAAAATALTDEAVDRAYQQWLSGFENMDVSIRQEALRHPKPSKPALLSHIEALRAIIDEGTKRHHRYLWFIGD